MIDRFMAQISPIDQLGLLGIAVVFYYLALLHNWALDRWLDPRPPARRAVRLYARRTHTPARRWERYGRPRAQVGAAWQRRPVVSACATGL